jgi:hypothetical protein
LYLPMLCYVWREMMVAVATVAVATVAVATAGKPFLLRQTRRVQTSETTTAEHV